MLKKNSSEAKIGQVTTIVAENCIIDGSVSAPDSIRVDGEVKGDVKVNGSLILGAKGKIDGNVTADNVFLAGSIQGNVDAAKGRVEISDTGRLIGDLTAHSLVIDENAVFQGQCSMTSDQNGSDKASKDKSSDYKDKDKNKQ